MRRALGALVAVAFIVVAAGTAVALRHGDDHGKDATGYHAVACPDAAIAVFLDPKTKDQAVIDKAKTTLQKLAPDAHIIFIDHAAAFAEFKALFPDEVGTLQAQDLPSSLRLTLSSKTEADRVMKAMRGQPGVLDVLPLLHQPAAEGQPPTFLDVDDLTRHKGAGVGRCQKRG